MYPTFKSSTLTKAAEDAITRRARLLCTLDHGDLAVLLARLEWAVRMHAAALGRAANVSEDMAGEAEWRASEAGQQVAAAVVAIEVMVAS